MESSTRYALGWAKLELHGERDNRDSRGGKRSDSTVGRRNAGFFHWLGARSFRRVGSAVISGKRRRGIVDKQRRRAVFTRRFFRFRTGSTRRFGLVTSLSLQKRNEQLGQRRTGRAVGDITNVWFRADVQVHFTVDKFVSVGQNAIQTVDTFLVRVERIGLVLSRESRDFKHVVFHTLCASRQWFRHILWQRRLDLGEITWQRQRRRSGRSSEKSDGREVHHCS